MMMRRRRTRNGGGGSSPIRKCDLFSGRWVYDNKSYPLYREGECSFLADDFACEKYGRKDLLYQHWRWQPHHCHLPRFNATALLEKLTGKRLVFVGDSLNKNQWMSMVCMLESSLSPSLKSSIWKGNLITFEAKISIGLRCSWNPTVMTQWGSFERPDAVQEKVEMKLRRYEMALQTWSDWMEFNINRSTTQLFFMSLSPYHKLAGDWGNQPDQNCYNETEPISRLDYWGSGSDKGLMQTAEKVIKQLESRGLKVGYLNITQLSDYRKDGHPSIHRKQWQPPTEEQLLDPKSYSECVHWCLPGVPDVWNQILYAYLMDHHVP
ncbi:unnamed protein product [Cuscuta campestris]|uniref:Uncharacterized protein n=1 Tax=Cuscuta campestris TaxID=132261 RepID=A0A484L4D7_9ASTE|nr:unnamed protein product [Cuscuta campestris]